MATSPIYNWPEPDNTDLVKNGALAIRTLGNAIDTTMGTMTPKSIVDAKGDLIAATANDTPARLPVGANDLLLTAASGETTGLKYTGAWTSFTPTWTNVTVGNATNNGRYCKIGKVVFVKINFNFGSTTSFTGAISFNNPIVGTGGIHGYQSGIRLLDAGTQFYEGFAAVNETTTDILIGNVSGTYPTLTAVNATVPFTWTSTDEIQLSYWYEVA
jgi:hypothetical protein